MRVVGAAVFAVVAIAVFGAAGASAAEVRLKVDASASSFRTVRVGTGGKAFMAPYTRIAFRATVTDDSGGSALPPDGSPDGDFAIVDLIERTVDGERIVNSQRLRSTAGVRFALQRLNQTSSYYARVRAQTAADIANATNSSRILFRAFLRHAPSVARYPASRTLVFSGLFAQPAGVDVQSTIVILVQRRAGTRWVTLARRVPNVQRRWGARVRIGRIPGVFRVRVLSRKPQRYAPMTDFRYCLAGSAATARSLCRTVPLGVY